MKFRGTSKIKTEHSMIKGLLKLLESIEDWEEIQGIIPGLIKPAKSSGIELTIQYITQSGVKCLAKSDGAVQEVFFVSSTPEILKTKLEQEFYGNM
jgi:hypothetical protein